MSRYFLAIASIIIAFSAVAFTPSSNKHPNVDQYVFQYSGPDFSVANVENEANWAYVNKNVSLCANINHKACRVGVIVSYVNNPSGPTPTLKTTTNISATLLGLNAYVSAIADPTNNIFSNQN